MIEQLQELLENMQWKERAAKELAAQAVDKGDSRTYDMYNLNALNNDTTATIE